MKKSPLILALSLAISIFPSVSFAEDVVSDIVSPDLAKKAAASLVLDEVKFNEESHWTLESKLGNVTEVYDPAGQKVAYTVDVRDDSQQPQGYIVVSAFINDEPIQMWADEGISLVEEKSRISSDSSSLSYSNTEQESLVWFGGTQFFTKKEIRSLESNNSRTTQANIQSEKYPLPEPNISNQEKWKAIDEIEFTSNKISSLNANASAASSDFTNVDPATWESGYNSVDKYFISGVENQKQWYYATGQFTGCSPTAASNIVMWYAQQYPSLNPTRNQRDIVMQLRKEMGTTQLSDGTGSTDFYEIDNGLQSYFRKNGRPNAEIQNGLLMSWDIWKFQLKNLKAPMLQSYWGQNTLGDHTVTVVGYKEFERSVFSSNSKYLVIKNNWSSDTAPLYYVKWGTWNTNVATYVPKP